MAEVKTRANDKNTFCFLRKPRCRLVNTWPIQIRIQRRAHVGVGCCPQTSIHESVAVVVVAIGSKVFLNRGIEDPGLLQQQSNEFEGTFFAARSRQSFNLSFE